MDTIPLYEEHADRACSVALTGFCALLLYSHPLWAENHPLCEGLYLHEDSKLCGMPPVWMYPSNEPRPPHVEQGLYAGKGFLWPF